MGMIQEFKEFAVKGNALDMAVGIILGLHGDIVDEAGIAVFGAQPTHFANY